MDYVSIPKYTFEAMTDDNWCQEMVEEMLALQLNNTMDIISTFTYKTVLGYQWFSTMKIGTNSQIDCSKTCLVTKGYT